MAKTQKEKKKKTFDDVSSDDSFAWFSTVLALVLGIAMIVIDYLKGESCKLRDVDVTTWRDPNQKGQIPLWMQAEGILFLASSLFYIFGRFMRVSLKPVGNILTGLCGKMTLFIIWIFMFMLNLLGYLWLYLARVYRTDLNSSEEGDPNYCSPAIWYTANIVNNLFWAFSAISTVIVLAQMYLFCLGPEYQYQKVIILGKEQDNTIMKTN